MTDATPIAYGYDHRRRGETMQDAYARMRRCRDYADGCSWEYGGGGIDSSDRPAIGFESRPQFAEVLAAARVSAHAGRPTNVVVTGWDRLSADAAVCARMLAVIQEVGAQAVCLADTEAVAP